MIERQSATGRLMEMGPEGEACLDGALLTLLGAKQGALNLEQKVSQLYELLHAPIYRYLLAVIANQSEAEELTQETFLKLYLSLRRGQQIGDVRAWLFRVAHNLAVDQHKGAKHRARLDFGSWEEVSRLLPAPGLDPEQTVIEMEKYERLAAALERLSPQQRQCLHLRAEGFRFREIAEILQIDTSSVAEFLRRAVKKLMV